MEILKLLYITAFFLLSSRTDKLAAVDIDLTQIIPASFPYQDINQYTVRYISKDGNDSESCLSNQVNSSSSVIQYCRTLQFAVTENITNAEVTGVANMVLLLLPGEYTLGIKGIELHNAQNIVVRKVPGVGGEVVLSCEAYDERNFNNFFVNASNYVSFEGLVLNRCGPRSPAIRTVNTGGVVVKECVFRDNFNNGLFFLQTNDVLIIDCIFHDNNSTAYYFDTQTLDPGNTFRFAGGLGFLWRDRRRDSLTLQATVRNCTFLNNHARINARNANDSRPKLYHPRGHGGGIVIYLNQTVNYKVVIEDTTFTNNTALYYGGGIFISLYRNSFSNAIIINNSRFEANKCNQVGGGISMNTFEGSNQNTMIVENSSFERNTAQVGGGACSIVLQDQVVAQEESQRLITRNNTARFSNCSFTSNESPEGGSAVGLVANSRVDQAVTATSFTDCNFTSNYAYENQSAVWSFRFPITFQGTTIIKNNVGGGVSLLHSIMDAKGSVWFEGNTAMEGGALVMKDQSVLHLLSHVNVTFIANNAMMRGGAIFVETQTVGVDSDVIRLFNTRCFIQYEFGTASLSTDPADWNATLVFINNTAGRDGAAIYATDVARCVYTPTLNVSKEHEQFMYGHSIFQVTPQFTFSGNRVLDESSTKRRVEDIATGPSNLAISPEVVSAAPGEKVKFKIAAMDESGNRQAAVWSINDDNGDEPETSDEEDNLVNFFSLLAGDSQHIYDVKPLSHVHYPNCGDGLTRKLQFSLVQVLSGDVKNVSTVLVNLTCCHPVYHFNETTGLCVHNHDLPIVVRPDSDQHYIYIKPSMYAEVRNGTKTVSAVMPPTFQNCSKVGNLTGCLFKYDSPDEQCSNNRTDFLCGRCPPDKGVDLTLLQCVDCTIVAAVIVAIIVVVFSVLSVLVLIFNIGIPNELKGCLFFVQVVGFIYHNQADSIDWDFHLSRVFGFSFYLPLCPYPGYTALFTTAYGLLLPLIAIVILILYILSARIIRPLSHRSSFEGIWLLSIITYKYLADTCFNILRCQQVDGAPGEYVFYYDGTIRCFYSKTHIGFAVFALVMGVVVILLFPVFILVISFKRFNMTQPFTDVLGKGIKSSCRWWSSFDLFRRLLFIFVVLIFNYTNPVYSQLALFFAGLLVFFIFACAKPYENIKVNFIEMLVLLDLLVLTALFLDTDIRHLNAVLPYAKALLLLPFISLVLYIGAILMALVWKKLTPTSFMMCVMKISDLFHGSFLKRHSALSHNLDKRETKLEVSQTESSANNDFDEPSELQAEYSAFREELLEND